MTADDSRGCVKERAIGTDIASGGRAGKLNTDDGECSAIYRKIKDRH